MARTLLECRDRIDEIDKQLMELFQERMSVVVDVATYKKENNLPIFNKEREDEVIKKNIHRLTNKELNEYAETMLHCLMDVSKEYQCEKVGLRETALSKGKAIKIGFQGVPGAFGEEALINYFGNGYETLNYEEFEDLFQGLKYKSIDYGILPIENSSTGSITAIYDLLKKYGFYIVGETKIRIEQNLLGIQGATLKDIKEIYSHPQGFEQSSEFLKSLRGSALIPYHNTAISAKFVKDNGDVTKAAIGSKRAAELYGLEVLKGKINNAQENYTRFIVIGRELEVNELCNKMTIVFTLPNESGSLYNQLRIFSEGGINMNKIESRPVGDGSFSYFFYVDIDGSMKDEQVKMALHKVEEATQGFRVLGAYKKF